MRGFDIDKRDIAKAMYWLGQHINYLYVNRSTSYQ